jgi:hypothetical protein
MQSATALQLTDNTRTRSCVCVRVCMYVCVCVCVSVSRNVRRGSGAPNSHDFGGAVVRDKVVGDGLHDRLERVRRHQPVCRLGDHRQHLGHLQSHPARPG